MKKSLTMLGSGHYTNIEVLYILFNYGKGFPLGHLPGLFQRSPSSSEVYITDTLSVSMTFIREIGYFDPESTFDPQVNGQQLVWEWGTMWAEQTWTFDLVVQIDEDVLPGTELLNQIEAWGDSPTDIEANPANNSFEYLLSTVLYKFTLPLALKSP